MTRTPFDSTVRGEDEPPSAPGTRPATFQEIWESFDRAAVGHAHAKLNLAGAVHAYVSHVEVRPPTILIRGPHGVGKTLLARTAGTATTRPFQIVTGLDEMMVLAAAPPRQRTIVLADAIDLADIGVEELDVWIDDVIQSGALIIATAADTSDARLPDLFDDTTDLSALSESELEEVVTHPASRLEQAKVVAARMGITIVIHPEAKKLLASTAFASGEGAALIDRALSHLAPILVGLPKQDCIIDRRLAEVLLRQAAG
ncbi:MAG: hypothetical protein KF819_13350 [Labilithrix sp.]|nr:hypothetical protein [Labilithrix sp.]